MVTKNYQIVIIRSTIKDGVSVLLRNDFYPDVVCTNYILLSTKEKLHQRHSQYSVGKVKIYDPSGFMDKVDLSAAQTI